MARPSGAAHLKAVSISVSAETNARLKRAAQRRFGGNLSALIESIAVEAERLDALDWLLQRAPPVDDEAFEAFMREAAGPQQKRLRRTAPGHARRR